MVELMKLKYYKRSAVIFASWIIPPKAEDIEDIHGIPNAKHFGIDDTLLPQNTGNLNLFSYW